MVSNDGLPRYEIWLGATAGLHCCFCCRCFLLEAVLDAERADREKSKKDVSQLECFLFSPRFKQKK